jgi:aspartyl protease family protein
MLAPELRRLSGFLRGTGYLGLLAALLLTVAESAYRAPHSEAAMLLGSKPELSVAGSETRIPIASDGHFWVDAQVNGATERFLIDTGATYTGLNQTAASAAGVEPDPMAMPLELDTANGPITARAAIIEELRFGTIVARDLKAAIAPSAVDSTNVIGMNLMSRLASWRVEKDTLILVPKG